VLQRLQRPFAGAQAGDGSSPDASPSPIRVALAATVVLAAFLLLRRRLRWRTTTRRPPATRLYLGLRRAYQRAGYAAASQPPLAFADAILTAPGGAEARRAVQLYLESRFGPAGTATRTHDELRRTVTAARSALRKR
jgi:MYXO-CTERM domain-containing protein